MKRSQYGCGAIRSWLVHRSDRHHGASGKERKVNYAEEENNTGGSAISHCRHADGSGARGHTAHVERSEGLPWQGRSDDYSGVPARGGWTLSIGTMHMHFYTCWRAPS